VEVFNPPGAAVDVARRRTAGIFREWCRRLAFAMETREPSIGFEFLLTSAYLQGVSDAAEALESRGWRRLNELDEKPGGESS